MVPRFLASLATALLLSLTVIGNVVHAAGAANDHTVLILESTILGGLSNAYAQKAIAMGYSVELASDANWLAKSTADFATYRAIIMGDPHADGSADPIAAAEATTNVWGPAIDGNVLVVGTDPDHHIQWIPSVVNVIAKGIEYVLATPIADQKTGLYFATSGYYNESGTNNPVDVLSYFGTFLVNENTNCHDDIHIVAPTHVAMNGLTDSDLSNWNCSIHALFVEWPTNFVPLAIADGLGNEYTAPDGHTGTPYVFARITSNCDVPASISVTEVTPDTLWSPNKKMIDIEIAAQVAGEGVNITRTITCSETPKAPWTVYYEDGADIFHFRLRADRNGNNRGRTYTIEYTATDACGNTASAQAIVVVPHDQGNHGHLK